MAAVRSVLVTAFAPQPSGNGSAMRADGWRRALSSLGPTSVLMAPVAGMPVPDGVGELSLPSAEEAERGAIDLARDARWREFLSRADPLPPVVHVAPPWLGRQAGARLAEQPDIVVAFKAGVAPIALDLAWHCGARLVVDLDDDEAVLLDELGDHGGAGAARRLRAELARHAAALCVASPVDATRLTAALGRPVAVVPNGVDVPGAPEPPATGEPLVLFVANLTYAPNVDGLRWFVSEVLPLIPAGVGVRIIGAGGGAALHGLDSERCDIRGWVDDLAPHYRDAWAVICPLLAGSGTRVKVLEAMAWARPVVATRAGIAGLDLVAGRDLLVADDAAEFAGRITAALGQRAALGRAGWEAVRRTYARAHVEQAIANLLSMDPTDRPLQTPGLDITEVDDGLVVYDPEQRRVHHLNVTSVLVFELATGENSVATIVEVVQRVFNLDEPPEEAVRSALDQLRTEGLIS